MFKINEKEVTDRAKKILKDLIKEKNKDYVIWCPYCNHWHPLNVNKKFIICKSCKKKFKLGIGVALFWNSFKIEKGKKKK